MKEKITVNWIRDKLEHNNRPAMLPDIEFRKKHAKIVEPYADEIGLYKGDCYKELNTYFKTGKVLLQGGCPVGALDRVAKKLNKTGLTAEEKVELVAKRLEELYNLVEPLDHDIVVYRGVRRGTIGQNMFTGKCVKTRLYELDKHRFCTKPDLEDIKLYKDRQAGESPQPYVYETLGFVSTTTDFSVANDFAMNDNGKSDTMMALRLPAGTKFIMPEIHDNEAELILFPKQSTFILKDKITTVYYGSSIPVYVGSYCNEINKWRPADSPKLRDLRVKILNPHDWWENAEKKHPLLQARTEKCGWDQVNNCADYLHFCYPGSGECIGDSEESLAKIREWWQAENVGKGKCDQAAVEKCIKKDSLCNPKTGNCLTNEYGMGELITNHVEPEEIIKQQKPLGDCDVDAIKKCAKEGQLCYPYNSDYSCIDYSKDQLWRVNHYIPAEEIATFVPVGSECTEQTVVKCAGYEQLCDPVGWGYCLPITKVNEEKYKKVLEKQTAEAKAKYKKQHEARTEKFINKIVSEQKPRYNCDTAAIKKCADNEFICDPLTGKCDVSTRGKEVQSGTVKSKLWYANNVTTAEDLKKMKPVGVCKKEDIELCASTGKFCHPSSGYCYNWNYYDAYADQGWKALQAGQTGGTSSKPKKAKASSKPKKAKPKKHTAKYYQKFTVPSLKKQLKAKGLKVSGKKADLISRLVANQ